MPCNREGIDVCIHWGRRRCRAPPARRRLFGEILLPVCSPGLFRRYPPPRLPGDLADHVLLCSMHRPDDWPTWLRAAGTNGVDGNSGLKFENSALAYQASIDELGIVMAQRAFVEDDLRTGRLVAPLALRAMAPSADYLAYPRSRRATPLVQTFERWIVEQTAGMEEAGL